MNNNANTADGLGPMSGFLSQGILHSDKNRACNALNLDEKADSKEIARALVRTISQRSAKELHMAALGWQDPREAEEVSRVFSLAPSYLGRLTTGASERRLDLERFDDARTLLGVLRAGTLIQRRAAARRLATLLEDTGKLSIEELREVNDTLSQLRDVEISHDLAGARTRLMGVESRRTRAMRREWEIGRAHV
jgi:hypothetical protein